MSERGDPLKVEIYGQTYKVRGGENPDYVRELAQLVDSEMRDIASEVPTSDPTKIAILAALNLADQLVRARRRQAHAVGVWLEKTEELADRLEETILESS